MDEDRIPRSGAESALERVAEAFPGAARIPPPKLPPVEGIREPGGVVEQSVSWHADNAECDGVDLYWGHCADDCAMVLFCLACSVPLCILGSGAMGAACDTAREVIGWMAANGGAFHRGPDHEG